MQIPPFKLERYFATYEFDAPYLLSSSDCEAMAIGDLLALEAGAAEAFQDQWLGYTESQGDSELRQEIARLYESVTPEELIVYTGAEEAIYGFMMAMLQPGDHVIVHTPAYQSLYQIADAIGCSVTHWQTRPENGWALDLDDLRASIRPETRLIVINTPHNPTGYLMDAATQQGIVELATRYGLWLFSDEVYRLLEHGNDAKTLSAGADVYENAVSLGVMSKTFGLPGLRIGWVGTKNRTFLGALLDHKDYTTICNSAPSEFLAKVGLRQRDTIIKRNLDIIDRNLDLLDDFFARHEALFNWQRPVAGSTAFPSITFDQHIEDFCVDVVEKVGVMLVPGTMFDYDVKHFRVGYGRFNMPKALEQFDTYIAEYLSS